MANKILCRNVECEPPFGGKDACEFNNEGCCTAKEPEGGALEKLIDAIGESGAAPGPMGGSGASRTRPFKWKGWNCGR